MRVSNPGNEYTDYIEVTEDAHTQMNTIMAKILEQAG